MSPIYRRRLTEIKSIYHRETYLEDTHNTQKYLIRIKDKVGNAMLRYFMVVLVVFVADLSEENADK